MIVFPIVIQVSSGLPPKTQIVQWRSRVKNLKTSVCTSGSFLQSPPLIQIYEGWTPHLAVRLDIKGKGNQPMRGMRHAMGSWIPGFFSGEMVKKNPWCLCGLQGSIIEKQVPVAGVLDGRFFLESLFSEWKNIQTASLFVIRHRLYLVMFWQ